MKYLKLFEAEQDELSLFRETIKMIFVDLIDEGFSVQMLTQQRVKAPGFQHTYQTGITNRYEKCNVIYVRLARFKDNDDRNFGALLCNKSEDYKDRITNSFETLLNFLDKRWQGAQVEKIIREDPLANDGYFYRISDLVWKDFLSITITIIKKNI